MGDDAPVVEVESRAAWRAWLAANHELGRSIWLITYKKHHPSHVSWDDIVEEAVCFGWIDSLPRKLDADRKMLRVSPRKKGSPWSRLSKERVARMEAAGKLAAPGRAVIARAQADGSWTVYDECEDLVVRPDLAEGLAAVPGARERWDAFSPSSRRGILWWIKSAKTPATRAKRIAETARLAALGLRAQHPEAKGR